MSWGAAEAFPLVLSLSCAVTWLQIATLKRSRNASPTLRVVSPSSKSTTSKPRLVESTEAEKTVPSKTGWKS